MMSGKTNAVRKKAQPQDSIEHLLRGHGQEQGSENWTFSWSTKMGLFPGNQAYWGTSFSFYEKLDINIAKPV